MKYQLENPNNCKISIDYKNKENPVKFEYIGKDTPFKICYRFFRYKIFLYYLIPIVFLVGVGFGGVLYSITIPQRIFSAIILSLGLFTWYFWSFIFALIFSKTKLIKYMPYLWGVGKARYYAEFKKEDIVNNKLEIPLYSNVYLHYQAIEDFKENLIKVEVIEHPFNMLVLKKSLFKKRRLELKRNEYLWKCIFTFDKLPEKGELRVLFT